MNSRPILKKARKINILIDSKTFNNRLQKNDRLAIAILSYANSDYFRFVRTPLETTYNQLNNIVEYELLRDENSAVVGIKINHKNYKSSSAFHYKMHVIKIAAQNVCKEESVGKDILDDITIVFIQAILNFQDRTFRHHYSTPFVRYEGLEEPNIYITNNPILLENRYWFEGTSPGCPLNIFSIEEASLLLDAFLKRNEKYCIASRYTTDKFLWYWLSMRLKTPHYNVGNDLTNSIASRLYYILMALDEITIQYYLGSNNTTLETTVYHFNYLVSLITGVFDSLALKTNDELNINWQNNMMMDITLSNRRKKGAFLDEIRDRRPDLRNHISTYASFIQLIFSIRDLIIHREGLRYLHFSNNDPNGWDANLIKIDEKTYNYIKYCGDTKCSNGKLTRWGVYKIMDEYMFEPHHFTIEAVNTLVKFVDEYLRLLGNPSFIEKEKQRSTDFARNLKVFEENHLGY